MILVVCTRFYERLVFRFIKSLMLALYCLSIQPHNLNLITIAGLADLHGLIVDVIQTYYITVVFGVLLMGATQHYRVVLEAAHHSISTAVVSCNQLVVVNILAVLSLDVLVVKLWHACQYLAFVIYEILLSNSSQL